MNDTLQTSMAEATRLTIEGQLAEATALIQRTLGGTTVAAPDVPSRSAGEALEPIEGSFRVVGGVQTAGNRSGGETVHPAGRTRAPGAPVAGTGTRPRPSPMPQMTGLPGGVPGSVRPRPRPTPAAGGYEGRLIEASYTGPAGTRAYRLYIPRGYTGQAVPLLVMLHGCTQTPEDFAAGTRMNTFADRETFLVAYPDQSTAANQSRCWNWFEAGHQARAQGEPAIIAGLTRQVIATQNVDARRVNVAGLSAGGAMAAVMGVAYPDLYAAAGVHSGLAYGAAGNLGAALAALQRGGAGPALAGAQRAAAPGVLPRTVPLIIFHGERDTTVHPQNADQVVRQWLTAQGAGAPLDERTEAAEGGRQATRTVYRDADGKSVVESWRVQGLGHAWSGGSPSGSYTDAQGPDASAAMVRFFREHPLGD